MLADSFYVVASRGSASGFSQTSITIFLKNCLDAPVLSPTGVRVCKYINFEGLLGNAEKLEQSLRAILSRNLQRR